MSALPGVTGVPGVVSAAPGKVSDHNRTPDTFPALTKHIPGTPVTPVNPEIRSPRISFEIGP